jgi:hypothetical protein
MKKIVIGASKNDLIGSKAIQWWLNTDYSHVYVRWYLSSQEREIVYQASHGMVHFTSLEHFTRDNLIVKEYVIDLTDEQFKKFSGKCIDLAGESYSKLELLQIFIRDIFKEKINFQDQPGYICSELMCELLEDIGIKFTKPKHLVRPDDIMKALEIYGNR